jgi:hypothetical protein
MKTKRQIIIGWVQKFRETPGGTDYMTIPTLIAALLELLNERPDFSPKERHDIVVQVISKHVDYLIDQQEGTCPPQS